MSNEKEQTTVVAPNKENVNTAQVMNLLGVIGTLASWSCRNTDEEAGINALDGGTKSALDATLITACNRLDSLLREDARWSVAEYGAVIESMTTMYQENTKLIKLQQALYADGASPHARYKPQILKLADGKWLAFAGDPHNLDNAICGVGDCPADAVDAFDAMFKGTVTEKLAKFLAEHDENKKTTLDTLGTGNPKDAESPKRKQRRNRREDGPEPSVSGE